MDSDSLRSLEAHVTRIVSAGGAGFDAARDQASALRDRGIMLDLSGLDMIEIDAALGTARVGVGVEGGALSERLAQAGFAFPEGHCIDVALSG